jgi:hypothetical protein
LGSDALVLVGDGKIVILNHHLLISHGHFSTSKRVTVSLVHGFPNLHAFDVLLLCGALADELLGPERRYQVHAGLLRWRPFKR